MSIDNSYPTPWSVETMNSGLHSEPVLVIADANDRGVLVGASQEGRDLMDHIVECVNTCARQEDNSWVMPHLPDAENGFIKVTGENEAYTFVNDKWERTTCEPQMQAVLKQIDSKLPSTLPTYIINCTKYVYNKDMNAWIAAEPPLEQVAEPEKVTYENCKRINRLWLLKDLESEHLAVREKAVNKLSQDYSPEATQALVELWDRERNPHLREFVEQVLEFRGTI